MIVFDIGNTDAVIGFFEKDILKHVLRIRSLKNENALYFEYRIANFMLENNIEKTSLNQAVISSVVPVLSPIFINFCESFLNLSPKLVEPAKSGLLKILIDQPEELGTDLFVNALAAVNLYDSNCLIVDFGTALTFTTVTKNKEILGVTILPGINTAIKSLFSETSLLPQVKLEKPATIIGKNSLHAIQAGIIYGYEAIVKGIVAQTKKEVGFDLKVIATGGLSVVLKDFDTKFDEIDKNLTLIGLNIYGKS
jgi:type III pantothenate kinase